MWVTELLPALVTAIAALGFAGAVVSSPDPVPMPPAKVTPRIDALPQPSTSMPIDLEALTRGFDNDLPLPAQGQEEGPRLLVFISLSMPEPTLKRLVEQAARAGAVLKLRGLLDGSLPRTVARMQGLLSGRSVSVQIDPLAFDRYGVQRVPAFVLLLQENTRQACHDASCATGAADLAAVGDVSLDYALAHFERTAPAFSETAGVFRARLGRTP